MPPVYAAITRIEQASDSLIIHWSPSPSDDVVKHRIFRRKLEERESWTLIADLDSTQVGQMYIDIGLDYDIQYGYTIIAMDDSGLQSEPAPLKAKYLMPPKEIFVAISKFEAELKKKRRKQTREVILKWELNEIEDVSKILVYRGWEDGRLGRYKYLRPEETSFSETINEKEKVFYRIKPIYNSRTGDYFSEQLEIQLPKQKEKKGE